MEPKTLIGLSTSALLLAVLVLLLTTMYQYSRNTLVENGNWINAKTLMAVSPMGAYSFIRTRHALHRNRLNLQAWHAYNEVLLNRWFRPGRIAATFVLGPNAWLSVLFNRNEAGYDGVRFSRDPKYPSLFFHADRQGRFEKRVDLGVLRLGRHWHELILDFSRGHLRVGLDGVTLALPEVTPLAEQFIGLRSGGGATIVDRISAVNANGQVILDETFRNVRGRGKVLVVSAVVLSLPFALFAIGVVRGKFQTRALFRVITLQVVLVITVSILAGTDMLFWSRIYVYYMGHTPVGRVGVPWLAEVEALRMAIFHAGDTRWLSGKRLGSIPIEPRIVTAVTSWDQKPPISFKRIRMAALRDQQPRVLDDAELDGWPPKDAGDFRLAFVGTSQTFGEGAEVESEAFVFRLHRILAGELAPGRNLETFNFSIKGAHSSILLQQYRRRWHKVTPDLVVINLSWNDTGAVSFERNLRAFIGDNREMGSATVLVIEPNVRWTLPTHEVMRRVASELDVPLFDLHGYMNRPEVRDAGFLWWDNIHLTSFGHRQAAAWLVERLRPLISSASAHEFFSTRHRETCNFSRE